MKNDENLEKEPVFGIPEVLQSLREDLDKTRANLASSGKDAALALHTVDVEFTVGLTGSVEAGGSVGFTVLGVNFGGKTNLKKAEQTTHKIKLSLKPTGSGSASGNDTPAWDVAGNDPE